jgi:hypothetical protein
MELACVLDIVCKLAVAFKQVLIFDALYGLATAKFQKG